jgi:hypothetical protein
MTKTAPCGAGTSSALLVSILPMRHNWPLRQLLAILRGIALMVAVLLSLILLQLVPSLIRGGLSGVRDHIARVAIAGVPPERWGIAVLRMYEALSAIVLLVCILFFTQRYLGRKLGSGRAVPDKSAQ